MKIFDRILMIFIGIILLAILVILAVRGGNLQKQNRLLQQQVLLQQQGQDQEPIIFEETPTPLPVPKGALASVSLGQEYQIGKNEGVGLNNENFIISVEGFSNNPCPQDAQCIWSGVGVFFEYLYKDERGSRTIEYYNGVGTPTIIERGGYRAEMIDTDLKTYAVIRFVEA